MYQIEFSFVRFRRYGDVDDFMRGSTMKSVIFYSWQSDIKATFCRSFIQNALEQAAKQIKKDEQTQIDPVIDRDTAGVKGSPDISHTIFSKIKLANLFVADVTIINSGTKEKATPNPNVLVELGYAASQLGWDRVVLVQNIAFGGPEMLPFDLRSRRLLTYSNNDTFERKGEEKAKLISVFTSIFKEELQHERLFDLNPHSYSKKWWGKWQLDSRYPEVGGNLFIRAVSSEGFLYDLVTCNGMHTGQISGEARFAGENYAVARKLGDEEYCELVFKKINDTEAPKIRIDQSYGCRFFQGMRASFDGSYIRKHDFILESGFLSEAECQMLFSVSGEHYWKIMGCFGSVSDFETKDTFPAKIIRGAPAGMFTINEALIMSDGVGGIWAAYTDSDKIYYFATELKWRETLPATIVEWKNGFDDREVVYCPAVNLVDDYGD